MARIDPVIDAPAKGVRRARWGPMNGATSDYGGPFHLMNARAVSVVVEFGGNFGTSGSVAIRGKVRDEDPDVGHSMGSFTSYGVLTLSDAIANRGVNSIHPTVINDASNIYVTAVAKYG